jgi:hypothetical protein
MKKNSKAVWTVVKINFRQLLPAYIVTAAFFLVGMYNLIACLSGMTDNYYVDMVNYLYAFAVMAPIIISARSFKRVMHLNGKKETFYWGTMLNYVLIAAGISLTVIVFFVCTNAIFGSRLIYNNLVDIFGWWKHGAVIAFVQQFLFLLLAEVFIHTLTSIQNRWYGWVVDGMLLTILTVFIPVPELRNVLIGFFNIIIYHSSVFVQMISCFALLVAGYLLYLPILRRKKI